MEEGARDPGGLSGQIEIGCRSSVLTTCTPLRGRMFWPLESVDRIPVRTNSPRIAPWSRQLRCRHDDSNGRYAIRTPITRSCQPVTRFPQKGFAYGSALLGELRAHVSVIYRTNNFGVKRKGRAIPLWPERGLLALCFPGYLQPAEKTILTIESRLI